MNLSTIRKRIAQHLINRLGWKSNRKIVVIESDDWGSVRMPSLAAYNKMKAEGIPVDQSPYCKYDSLASEEDLHLLFESLLRFKDSEGNHPVITANCVVSNPDFEKIRQSEFEEYICEPIDKTFQRYPKHHNSLEMWKQGDRDQIFHPQSHGKEHLNSTYWLKLLQNGASDFRIAFQNECWGLSKDIYPGMKRSVQAAFDMEDQCDHGIHVRAIEDGLNLFKEIFGYYSESFIANNYIWSQNLNRVLAENGVKYLQGMKYQKLPIYDRRKRKMIRHHIGEKNDLGQYYLIRNCSFEPSLQKATFNNVEECLSGIATAFLWNRPAIICSHRINYVGYLNADNRNRNLEQFNRLIAEIISKWPDVEFMTSDQLGRLIESDDQEMAD